MEILTNIMLEILKFFYVIGGHNYGLAIIWLTIAVNFALYPLTLSSLQQMSAMQRIQPRLQELQKKFKDDPKKMQKETLDLYRSEGVNPLGGCLPVLLKIPFFLALFFALQSKEFIYLVEKAGRGASFFWITNLAKPDPGILGIPIFALLIGATTWLTQKTMPSSPTAQTTMMTWFMPIFITFISVPFPAGVQLYWIVSNLIGTLQQAYIIKQEGSKQKRKGFKL